MTADDYDLSRLLDHAERPTSGPREQWILDNLPKETDMTPTPEVARQTRQDRRIEAGKRMLVLVLAFSALTLTGLVVAFVARVGGV